MRQATRTTKPAGDPLLLCPSEAGARGNDERLKSESGAVVDDGDARRILSKFVAQIRQSTPEAGGNILTSTGELRQKARLKRC